MIQLGIDVSHWQDPELFDWEATARDCSFLVARAAYGDRPDESYNEFVVRADDHGMVVGAYLFFRQTVSARRQLEAFCNAADLGVDGERDLLPVLDLEENREFDGPVDRELFIRRARIVADGLRDEFGGVILYYSAEFPGRFSVGGHSIWPWWNAHPDVFHWVAHHSVALGKLHPSQHRHSMTWHLHQGEPRTMSWYARGMRPIDVNAVNPEHGLGVLRMGGMCE